MVNAKNDRYLSQWKYLSFFGIACCIGLYIIVVEKLLYEYRPKTCGSVFYNIVPPPITYSPS